VASQRIRIRLRSYDHAVLDQSAGEIVRTARARGDLRSVPADPAPVYTVLRPPRGQEVP
jgi:small subunit ribosomal protein S10